MTKERAIELVTYWEGTAYSEGLASDHLDELSEVIELLTTATERQLTIPPLPPSGRHEDRNWAMRLNDDFGNRAMYHPELRWLGCSWEVRYIYRHLERYTSAANADKILNCGHDQIQARAMANA